MHIATVRISGFKPFPFCVNYNKDSRKPDVQWHHGSHFEFTLPTLPKSSPMISAIIGANSTGKSCVLYALDTFFSSTPKLPAEIFHCKAETEPIVIELELVRRQATVDRILLREDFQEFANEYCHKDKGMYRLWVGTLWPAAGQTGRFYYIRRPDGTCHKVNTREKKLLTECLFPVFRLIPADSRLRDEADPGKKNLLQDLVDDLLASAAPPGVNRRNAIASIRRKLNELDQLVQRAPGDKNWRHLRELEDQLSEALRNVTPGNPIVSIDLTSGVPNLESLFRGSSVKVFDGIELDFEKQGLGLQRSFVLALLKTWCERTGKRSKSKDRDYIFTIEEPEIYLHPHATRVMLTTLQSIAKRNQVIFTTHSSEFVNQVPLGHILLMRRTNATSHITQPDFSDLPHRSDLYKVSRYLQESRSDMLFAKAVLLVEGQSELYALSGFARTLTMELDESGISIVCTHSKDNFRTYHLLLQQFGIPHVILGDGDGNKPARVKQYTSAPFQLSKDHVFVLDCDFEREMATHLSDDRLCEIINEARAEVGENQLSKYEICKIPPGKTHEEHFARTLKNLGKPLVGRIVGDKLTDGEIRNFTPIVDALNRVLDLA